MHSHLKKPLLQDEQLYFIHVPKCAGTSFISLVDECYVIDEIIPTHYDLKMLQERITDDQLASYRFIRGHFPYDLIVPRLPKIPRIITFLREPVVRLISNFGMRQRVSDPLQGLQSALRSITLEEFLEREDLMKVFANRATRLIGGSTTDQNGSEVCNLELAKRRLAEMDFIGIVENYNDSLALFCYIFDFPPVQGGRVLNVSPDREKRSEISQATLKKVAETEWADIELYKFGCELFENQLARMKKELADNVSFPPPPKMNEIKDHLSLVNPGMGWHVAERHSKYGVIRWSGPEKVSHLHYSLKTDRDLVLKFDIIYFITMDVLDSLTVRVNGVIIPLIKYQNEEGLISYEARISRRILLLSEGFTSLTFEVNRTVRPIDIDPQNPDERFLGLCYRVVSLIPAPPKMNKIRDHLSLVYPGMGWHVAERHSKYGEIRWSGPEKVSHLHYSLKTDRDLVLKFDIVHFITMDVLNSLTVRVNGVIIPLEKHQNEEGIVSCEARIPREVLLLSEGFTNLAFEVNRTVRPIDIDPQNLDERLLGLCYHVVSLNPA